MTQEEDILYLKTPKRRYDVLESLKALQGHSFSILLYC